MSATYQIATTLGHYAHLLSQHGLLRNAESLDGACAQMPIAFATCDSREVSAATLFVCKGAAFKKEYLAAAVQAGAVAYVSEVAYEGVAVPCLLVSDIRESMALIAVEAYAHPSEKIAVCGFTGTKGKTTSVYYLKGIFDEVRRTQGKPGSAFLTGIRFDDGIEQGKSVLTTPEPFDLQRHLAHAVAADAGFVSMEVSSQALKYHRVDGMEFAVGAFTNFGEDHISPIEHPTLEDYFNSKMLLFKHCKRAVVNVDVDCAADVLDVAQRCERVVTYSMGANSADVVLRDFGRRDGGVDVSVDTPAGTVQAHIPTPALFNVENALAAIAIAVALDVDASVIARGVSNVAVPGRMETFSFADDSVRVIVDYAHNGMSLQALLENVRESYPDRQMDVLFGATGGKGVERRFAMGAVAGQLADKVVITEDDPGPEDPAIIAQAIADSIKEQGSVPFEIILDRETAIYKAIAAAKDHAPSVVVVAGKGHECLMKRAAGTFEYPTDSVVVQQVLSQLQS